jgi:hypothetical protein
MDLRPPSENWRTLSPLPTTVRRLARQVAGRDRVKPRTRSRTTCRPPSLRRRRGLPRATGLSPLLFAAGGRVLPMRPLLRSLRRRSRVVPDVPPARPGPVDHESPIGPDQGSAGDAPSTLITAAVARPSALSPRDVEDTQPHPAESDPLVASPRPERVTAPVVPLRRQPLPRVFHPLARAVVGDPEAVELVTGAETRQALDVAGAAAATTGTTIHLPDPPRATPHGLGVVAHELSHVADEMATGPVVAETSERRAHKLGIAVQQSAAVPDVVKHAAGPLSGGDAAPSLPFSLPTVTREQSHDRPALLPAPPPLRRPELPARSGRAAQRAVRSPSLTSVEPLPRSKVIATSATASRGRPVQHHPGPQPHFLLGLPVPDLGAITSQVDELPVGGVAAAVRGAMQSPLAAAFNGGPAAGEPDGGPVSPLGAIAQQAGAAPATGGGVSRGGVEAGGGTSGAALAAGGARGQSSPATGGGMQLGQLAEALEERVIAELERRGGRYAGVF